MFEGDDSVLQSVENENVKSSADTNTDDITEESVQTSDNFAISEEDQPDYPSDKSDMQSSIKGVNNMEQLEKDYNVPLFLSLNCTIRDKSHLSSTMVSMPAEYLPACFGKLHQLLICYRCNLGSTVSLYHIQSCLF